MQLFPLLLGSSLTFLSTAIQIINISWLDEACCSVPGGQTPLEHAFKTQFGCCQQLLSPVISLVKANCNDFRPGK